MIIRMLKDQKASVDGYTINDYLMGQVYDMKSDSQIELANVFLCEKWAVEVIQETVKPQIQEEPRAQVSNTRKRRK